MVVPGTILDSAAMMHVVEGPQGRGQRVQLLGVTGDQVSAEIADVVFPIMKKTLVLKKTQDNNSSLADLLKVGFKVTWTVGTKQDPNFGGVLTTPTGDRATLIFKDNL